MKKILKLNLFTLILLGFTISSTAQVDFGVKAGLNLNDFGQSVEDEAFEIPTKMRPGFHIGVVVDYGLTEALSLTSGLTYIVKGTSLDLEENLDNGESVDGSSYINFAYLEIPINLTYRKNNFSVFGGPYIGLGIGGKLKSDYTLTTDFGSFDVNEETKIKPAYGEINSGDLAIDEDAYNGLDFGINLGVGYEVGPVVIGLSYSLGFVDLEPKFEGLDKDDDKITNRVISLSGTYMF